MSQIRASCSRVTHPSAGRRQGLLPALPLDLHVLSLPLAFILSQDQTLLCIFSIILSLTPTLISKEINALDFSCFSVLACTYLISLFNDLVFPLRKAGCKGRNIFLQCKFYFNFFTNYSGLAPRQECKKSRCLSSGIAKVATKIEFPNYFLKNLKNYIIPPAGIAGAAAAGSGMSTIPHSVVRNMPATEAAFSSATRATLVGSMTPASNSLTYSPVLAL